ncbi:MAG: hypothetical protein RMJ87_01515 [Cytophagales bacterium]|nr:hypothetical protein [Bernardetiaceae bacterium]MDW8203680.1 hypothetical protein [Cytophagales bacterium]
MKRFIIALTTICLAGSNHWLVAQEYDDVYFTAKDRGKMSYSAAVLAQPSALGSAAKTLANDPVKSKFANPEYKENAQGNNISILPYFRKDYNQNNAFAGSFRNWNAPATGFWGNGWNMSFGSAAFWGMSPFLTSRWNWGWGISPTMMAWNDPWLMNRMMMWDPFWGTGMMSPMMMAWNDPWLMNRMMMWDPFWGTGMMSPWAMNSLWNPFFRPGIVVVDRANVQYGSRTDRTGVYTPVRARADEYFRGGRTEESAVRSSRYGNFDNSSAGRSAYVANEFNSGRSNGYAGQSEWATGRSSNYEMRQSGGYNDYRNSNFGSMNSGRSSSFDAGSYGSGGYGGGAIRSVGGRGGRGN